MKAADYIKENEQNMIEDIRELAGIPSILDEETAGEGRPFGQKIAEALDWVLKKASDMGMAVKNYDGYAGEITLGQGERMIGILGHIDVVAAGEGWNTDPFEIQVSSGRLYGRGTSDDKGPIVSGLYAMKYMAQEHLLPAGVCVRMIVGADEEENWQCIEHYVRNADRLPDYSIVPDGNFPLINCEKGLLDVDFTCAVPASEAEIKVAVLRGGTAKNVVPGKAFCTLVCGSEETAKGLAKALNGLPYISAEADGRRTKVTAQGKGTHAMTPEKGRNAVSLLMDALEQVSGRYAMEPVFETYNRYIGMTYNGENFGCAFEDAVSGKLTFNVGTMELKDGRLTLGASVRYPASIEKTAVIGAMQRTCAEAGIKMDIRSHMDALYVEQESDFVQVLMKAYSKVSGDGSPQPIAIGGATYARTIPNAVAFGPLFPYEEELAHEPNEYLDLESLRKMTLIYIEALKGLANLEI